MNTLFGCVATTSDEFSFRPLWRPPFLSRLAAEDRCHLNGIALRDGRLSHATACARSDVADGWREHRTDGGVVLEVESGEVVLDGLSMPHSPRWHDDRLWLLDSGRGWLGYLDERGFEQVAFCRGFARGLRFTGGCAVVGISRPRHGDVFEGLELEEALAGRRAEPRCGLLVIDLASGDVREWLWLDGVIGEIYDVALLPGVTRPMAIGFQSDEICRVIHQGPESD